MSGSGSFDGTDDPGDGFRSGHGSAPDHGMYPLALDVRGRRVVVVGGGPVAARRARALADAGADLLVVAPALCDPLASIVASEQARWDAREYAAGDLDGAWLVHTATGNRSVDDAVAADAEANRVWCVRADDATASAAWTPAVARVGDILVAVSGGRDPGRARALRNSIQTSLESGELPLRPVRPAGPRSGSSGPSGPSSTPGTPGTPGSSSTSSTRGTAGVAASTSAVPAGTADASTGAGNVALVGGGPGDSGLITTRGRRLLAEADVVVVDRLAPRALLDELDDDVVVIDVGKTPGNHIVPQVDINRLLVEHARAGKRVVRLKGGDPFVLGRGGEEARACHDAGVPVEVVPGVTSAVAVPAAAGIPVTHRGISKQFTVVSGHEGLDWAALAATQGTLVFLMGVSLLADTAAHLVDAGMSADTPAAVIENGYGPQQRLTTGTLETIGERAADAGAKPPAVIVVGHVVDVATRTTPR